MELWQLIPLIAAYLLGSLPWAVWIGRWMYGVDVREHGSGNAGATNVFRVLGKKAGIPVLVLDALKGFVAVNLIYVNWEVPHDNGFRIALGLAAVLGHIFPLFAQFRGGKGIATILGVIIALHPQAAALSLLVFLVVWASTSFISLSSIIASLSFPLWLIFQFQESSQSLVMFSMVCFVLVLITHQKNLERLLIGEEKRTRIRKRN